MRNFGFADYDEVGHVGTNGKMTEVAAAMGLTSLESREQFVAANRAQLRGLSRGARWRRRRRAARLRRRASSCNCQYVVVEVDDVRRL